jgi:hypothetical protein
VLHALVLAFVLALVLAAVAVARPQQHASAEGLSEVPFADSIERWRPLAGDAAETAQRLTGVRLDEDLLLALVDAESGGELTHRSDGGMGLTGIEPTAFEDLRLRYPGLLVGAPVDPRRAAAYASAPLIEDPRANLLAGALHLAECARALGSDLSDPYDLTVALHAYRFGPRVTIAALRGGGWLPAETVEQAAHIMGVYRRAAAARADATRTDATADPPL